MIYWGVIRYPNQLASRIGTWIWIQFQGIWFEFVQIWRDRPAYLITNLWLINDDLLRDNSIAWQIGFLASNLTLQKSLERIEANLRLETWWEAAWNEEESQKNFRASKKKKTELIVAETSWKIDHISKETARSWLIIDA